MIPSREHKPELDKYEVFEEIGHGGMATVYRGRDRRLDREVAVKVIHRHLRENQEVAARFVSEARAVAKVKHPNIVEVYDVSDESDDERYLVVELVKGTTLRKLLQQHGHLPAEVAAAIGLQIGAGLCHAHEHSIVHRDVKPENVLVDVPMAIERRRGTTERPPARDAALVKITDFGIAKLLDAQGVTATGQVLGSPAHMAPEQIEGADVDARADVFGMGVLLYECMVGKLPFDGKNPAQVLRRVLDGTYVPADRARPTVGSRWSRILSRALARDAADRYESVAAFCDELRAETTLLGFDEPERELADYLRDRTNYVREYEPLIVARLVAQGRRARTQGDSQLAAAHFNRALAFRPSDPELLKAVAGLARRERWFRVATRAAGGTAILAVLAGVVYATALRGSAPQVEPTAVASGAARPVPAPPSQAGSAATSTTASAPPPVTDRPPVAARGNGQRSRVPARVVPPAPPATRRVKVIVRNASGGSVKIDGQLHNDWFGTTYTLPVGPHQFEFVPPNAECCVAPPPVTVTIEPDSAGTGEPQAVYGTISFRDATLQFTLPSGTEASCPGLFLGKQEGPGQRRVQMGRPEVTEVCTVLPGPDQQEPPKNVDVTLRAGRTSYLVWP